MSEHYDQLQLLYVEPQSIFKRDGSFALVSFEFRLAEAEACMLSVCCCNFYRENDKIGTRTGVNKVSVDRQAIQKSSFVSMRIVFHHRMDIVGSSGINHFLNSQLIDRGIAISIFMDLGQYKIIVPFESAKESKTKFFSTCHGTSATQAFTL